MTDSPQIKQLKERYKKSFPEKLEIVQRVRAGLLTEGGGIEIAKGELHKLAGSSGMYGYDALAADCRSAMSKLEANEVESAIGLIDRIIKFLAFQD